MKTPLLDTPPEHVPYTYVRETGQRAAHMAASYELRPLCTCLCASPSQQRRAGDTLCICICHSKGPKHTLALCGRKPVKRWSVLRQPPSSVVPVCQVCQQEACKGPPPAPPPPPVLCAAPCTFLRTKTICKLPEGHYGLHASSVNQGKGRVSW